MYEAADDFRDPRRLNFSQAHGYEELPAPLQLEELPPAARTQIWNAFYRFLESAKKFTGARFIVVGDWADILRAKHVFFDNLPLDEWTNLFDFNRSRLRESIETSRFSNVFDLIQFVLRHPKCPHEFIAVMAGAFEFCRLAYTIDAAPPVTIVPAVTGAEGNTVVDSMRTLRRAGLAGSATHLRNASERINGGDWAGSVRESVHAVESVARQLDPKASDTLGPALASLENRQTLHPALKRAFSALYGYTSDEQGIRHSLLDQSVADVGLDEAVFMLGACASFASYLWRKHSTGQAP